MKKILMPVAVAALTLGMSQSASAVWGDNWGGNGYNDWPTWTPMYWMEEMFDNFDDNNWGGNNSPWGWNRGNGYHGYAPYGYAPYGYGYPQQYSPYGYAPQPQKYSPYGYGYPQPGYAPQPYPQPAYPQVVPQQQPAR